MQITKAEIENAVQYLKDNYQSDLDYLLRFPITGTEYHTIDDIVSATSGAAVFWGIVGAHMPLDMYQKHNSDNTLTQLLGESLLSYLTCIVALQIYLRSLFDAQNKDPRLKYFKIKLERLSTGSGAPVFLLAISLPGTIDRYISFRTVQEEYVMNQDDPLSGSVRLSMESARHAYIRLTCKVKELNSRKIADFLKAGGF